MWTDQISELNRRREQLMEVGGAERISRQHSAGKMTARERIAYLLDDGSFFEIESQKETDRGAAVAGEVPVYPGDGVIIGWGTINGRKVCVSADDFTVIGGTLGAAHAAKIARLQDLALSMRVPIVFLNDSGGARIGEGISSLSGYGAMFVRHVRSSGVIPQICAIMGPCSGGACYSPALCDFIFLVEKTSKMFLTGPLVVEAMLGTKTTPEELGGSRMHSRKSGVGHVLCADEKQCLEQIRCLLSFLPQNCQEAPPVFLASQTVSRNSVPDLKELVPDNQRIPFDVRKVIRALTDNAPQPFEIQPHFAANVVTTLACLDGHVTGIIANQPLSLGGSIDCDASDKIARFIRLCDSFHIPLLTLEDVPAFLPGKDQEQRGIIRHGAKILYAYAEAQVPKITVILRKAYGGAYIAMNSKTLGADFVYAWPIAQIAVMGAQGAVGILHRRELEALQDESALSARRKELEEEYEERFLNPWNAAARGFVDEVILPEETRSRLIESFAVLRRQPPYPDEKSHGNIPL